MRTTRAMIDHELQIARGLTELDLQLLVQGDPRRYQLTISGSREVSHCLTAGEMHSALNMLNHVVERMNRRGNDV